MTPLIYELHWLPIKYRIELKILLITFKILNFLEFFIEMRGKAGVVLINIRFSFIN